MYLKDFHEALSSKKQNKKNNFPTVLRARMNEIYSEERDGRETEKERERELSW